MELNINHLNEDPDFLRLLNDFDISEQTFLSPYSVNPNNLDDKKSVQVYHSDHNNAEAIAMVDEMMKIENVHDYHKEDDQCDATANSLVATTCDGVNGSNNNEEVELDFLLGDPKFLEYLDEVLNTGVTVVAQEGEAGCGGGDSTLRNENELIDFEKYLEKVLVGETATQELIHNATDQTEAVSKINNTGCENDVQVYHSDHNNPESMVDKMMNIENVHDYHKEDDQCDATAKSVVATACDGVNGSNNNELEYREEVLNTSGTVVTQEGEAEYGGGDSTLINENELIDFEKYLEKVLVGESATQELIHNATDQTEAVSKINNTGNENNVKRWKTRKRLKKGTPEFAQRQEMYKLMNRVAAAKSFERKKAYIEQLELQVQKLRLEIASRKNWLLFLRTANKNYRTRGGPSELRRTISASIFL